MIPSRPITRARIQRVQDGTLSPREDVLATEEPMEIRLLFHKAGGRVEQSVSITMRTPGDDFELAAGFLFSEGIIESGSDIRHIAYCAKTTKKEEVYNVVQVELEPHVHFDRKKLSRHFYANSSCGVCGKSSLASLEIRGCPRLLADHSGISVETVSSLPEKLRAVQRVFEKTGGLHAAALFDLAGHPVGWHEDVGRHNAVDKLIGRQLMAGNLPLHNHVMLVSGRAGFEIVQKGVVAGIPIIAAVGAPSSLAVETAQNFGMTLIGFLRGKSFNIYSSPERIRKKGAE